MTIREDPPGLPPCPKCHLSDEAELIAPPKYDVRANKFCSRCNRIYVGSPLELQNETAAIAAKEAERMAAEGAASRRREQEA